jgi:hypothetical protein
VMMMAITPSLKASIRLVFIGLHVPGVEKFTCCADVAF